MDKNSAQVYDGISVFFLALTALTLLVVVIMLLSPADDNADQGDDFVAVLPVILQLPTVTPSNTPRPTLPPTFTPLPSDTPFPSDTPSPTATISPSPTLSNTPGPTLTPSNTPTPSVSPTNTPTETPLGPTLTFTPTDSPYFFALREDVFFGPNGVNSAGCQWQGIGGSVLNQDGTESTRQLQVRVFGGGIERVTTTGSNSLYGVTSGWEAPVDNQINNQTYFVRLESMVGIALSEDVQVAFPGDCNANSAIVRFIQIKPFGAPPA
jgi:hypothetical protein